MNGPTGKSTGRLSRKTVGSSYARQALLPEGFRDQLAPMAEHEAALVRGLVDSFQSYGYDRVSPPVVEYETSLLIGAGASRANAMFRVMDPDTQKMMAVRADMTVQISRLAATRLADAQRPLRLCYSGNVLRTKGSQLRPSRQFVQAGIELVGSASLAAEFEVIKIAVESLAVSGIQSLSLDLTIAPLVQYLCDNHKVTDSDRALVVEALNAKDSGALGKIKSVNHSDFVQLLSAAGPAGAALEVLRDMKLSGSGGQLIARLGRLVEMLENQLPLLSVTIDPCESNGFEYKSGIGFGIFAKGSQSELGRGGRYLVEHPDGHTEEAIGFSVYLDSLQDALPAPEKPKKLFLPTGTSNKEAADFRRSGWRTIQGLTEEADPSKEAYRLGCSHILHNGTVEPLLN